MTLRKTVVFMVGAFVACVAELEICARLAAGTEHFEAYLHELEEVIRDAAHANKEAPARDKTRAQGWAPA